MELRVAGKSLLKARHADQHHAHVSAVVEVAQLLEAGCFESVCFVNHEQIGRLARHSCVWTVRSGEALFAYNVGAEQGQNGNAIVGGGFQSSVLRLNNVHSVTGDVRVRKALNHAIDRASIVKSIFRGTTEPIAFFGFQAVKLQA
jgi:hypothetical protein